MVLSTRRGSHYLNSFAPGCHAGKERMRYPVTPDGRYFVVRGRLWRRTNPNLPEDERQRLVSELMRARSEVGRAKRADDAEAERRARRRVHESKVALGERGPVWWLDGAPDYNRRLVKNTPYHAWFESLQKPGGQDPGAD